MKKIFSWLSNYWPILALGSFVLCLLGLEFAGSHEFRKVETFKQDMFYFPLIETIEHAGIHAKDGSITLLTNGGSSITYLGAWYIAKDKECGQFNLTTPTVYDPDSYDEQNLIKHKISYKDFIFSMIKSNAQNTGRDVMGQRWIWKVHAGQQGSVKWDLYDYGDGTCYLTFVDTDGERYQQKLKN